MQATTLSSTEIQVTWEPLPAIARNGIITTYEVQHEPLITFGVQLESMLVNSSGGLELSLILTGLEEFVEYNITVRAYTSAGAGPFSETVTNVTFEDGKIFYFILMLYDL